LQKLQNSHLSSFEKKKKFKKNVENEAALLGRLTPFRPARLRGPIPLLLPARGRARISPADGHHVAAVHRRRGSNATLTAPSGWDTAPLPQAALNYVPLSLSSSPLASAAAAAAAAAPLLAERRRSLPAVSVGHSRR